MNRTPAAAAAPHLPPRARQCLHQAHDGETNFHDLVGDSSEIRGGRRLAAASLDIGLSPLQSGAGLMQASPDAEDADKNPMRPFGARREKDHAECPVIQPARLPPQRQSSAPSEILSAVCGDAPALSIGDPESFGAFPSKTPSLSQRAAQPAPDEHKEQSGTGSTAPEGLPTYVQIPPFIASAQMDEPEPLRHPGSQAGDGFRFRGPVNPNSEAGNAARRHAPEALEIDAGTPNVTAGLRQQAAMLSNIGAKHLPAPIADEGGQMTRVPKARALSDTPKFQARHDQNMRGPAEIGVQSAEAETAMAVASDVSSTHSAAQRHEPSQTFERRGNETLAPSAPHEPISISPIVTAPFAANISEPAGFAQYVLKQVEAVIKGGEALAPAAPLHDSAKIRFQGAQASTLKFKLHPAELGEVQVTMRVSNERVFVDVSVENAEAYDALVRDREEMSAKLAALGLHINQVTVHNSQSGGSASGQSPNESGDARRQDPGHRFDSRSAPEDQGNRSEDEKASFETGFGNANTPASRRLEELHAEGRSIYI